MSNSALLLHHISLVAKTIEPADLEIYHANATLTLMYSPEGHTHVLQGPEAITRFMSRIGEFFEITSRPAPRVVETSSGAFAEYQGDMICKENGNVYKQDYAAISEIDGDRIRSVREYYDPIRVLKAFGEM